MNIPTIEGRFEYQMQQVLTRMLKDYKDNNDDETPDVETFADFIWTERKALGEFVFEATNDWCNINEICQKVIDDN